MPTPSTSGRSDVGQNDDAADGRTYGEQSKGRAQRETKLAEPLLLAAHRRLPNNIERARSRLIMQSKTVSVEDG